MLEGAAQAVRTVKLQQVVELIDVSDPIFRPAMDDLGELRQRRLAKVEQLLPLEVSLGVLAGGVPDDNYTSPWTTTTLPHF